jgi:NADH dehydrogenase
MTVMVVGASGVIGRSAVRALLARDEVRATVRRPEAAEVLRALGAKVAVRDPFEDLGGLLGGCHTLVHLVGGLRAQDDDELFRANHASVLHALEAAREAGVKRFVMVSAPGAHPEAANPFLRAKGLAEEAVAASELEYAIIRSSHVYGLGGFWFTAAVEGALADPPFAPGTGEQEVAPVFADDLAAVIAAVDDSEAEVAGTWASEGPDVVTADGLVRLLRGEGHEISHGRAAERLSELLGIPVTETVAGFLGLPSRADAPDAAGAFGVALTPLLEGLRITLHAAADIDAG